MMIAQVIGTVVSSQKEPTLEGLRLLVCQPLNAEGIVGTGEVVHIGKRRVEGRAGQLWTIEDEMRDRARVGRGVFRSDERPDASPRQHDIWTLQRIDYCHDVRDEVCDSMGSGAL